MTPAYVRNRLAWRLAVVFLLIVTMSWSSRHYQLDDALIYARYIQHALQGKGLVFNTGERVNGLTSVLDTWMVLGVAALAKGHILAVEITLSGIFLFIAAALAEATVEFSGIFLAANSFLYFCKGMETTLFLAVLVLCVLAYQTGRVGWLPVLCGYAVLTRFEGGALVAVIGWRLWRTGRLPAPKTFLAPAALLIFYLAFNLHYYHAMLPGSASAKLGQGLSGFWGWWPTAFLRPPAYVFLPLGGSGLFMILLAILAWFGRKDERLAKWNEIVLPFLGILAAFYILGNIPGYFWYYAPFFYFLSIYAVCLVPRTRSSYVGASTFGLCLAISTALYLHRTDSVRDDYIDAGLWLDHNAAPDADIASVETGYIGWYCSRHLIDIIGLTTPQNAVYTAHRDFSSWFAARPDYIVVHPHLKYPWEKIAFASPEYELVPVRFGEVALLYRKSKVNLGGVNARP